MLRFPLALAAAVLFTGSALAAGAQPNIPPAVAAAVADTNRPAEHRQDDAVRMPAAVVAFSGMKPGDKVVDFLPGGGYYTRIFSKVVGPQGKVYGVVPAENLARRPQSADGIKAVAAMPAYGNITVIHPSIASFAAPEPVDIVWTSNNYHDLKNANDAAAMLALNRGILNALKPGGTYIVIDHAAEAGSGARDTQTLHRVDPELVKSEVVSAGFKFEGASDVLKHPDDPHTARVHDPSVRGKTDQFLLKFSKPK